MLVEHVLVIWTVVACQTEVTASQCTLVRDWRPIATFRTVADCQAGAKQLGLEPKRYRCVSTGKV